MESNIEKYVYTRKNHFQSWLKISADANMDPIPSHVIRKIKELKMILSKKFKEW